MANSGLIGPDCDGCRNVMHGSKPSATWRSLTVAALMGICLLMSGCNGDGSSNNRKTQSAMVKSSGKFNKGYQEGMKQAQRSRIDWNSADMWLWMSNAEYKQGYERGWNDGRTLARLKSYQGKQLGEREPLTPTPSLLKQAQAQRDQPATPATPKKGKGASE